VDRSLIEAALSVRDEGVRTSDLLSLFHQVGDRYASEMLFEAEKIAPTAFPPTSGMVIICLCYAILWVQFDIKQLSILHMGKVHGRGYN